MGNKNIPSEPQPTQQLLQTSFQFIGKHQGLTFTKTQLLPHIKTILHSLRTTEPIKKEQNILHINPSYLKFIFSPYYAKQIMKCVHLLVSLLQQLNKKSLSFVKIQQVVLLTYVADFILYFSNQKILQNFDTLLIRSDVSQQNKILLKNMQKLYEGELQVNGNIVQKMNNQELQIVQKCLRITIMNFINVRLKPFSRSDNTLKYFFVLQQSLFMLYTKLYMVHHFTSKQPNLSELNQHFKSNLTIGAYFLSCGTSYSQPSLYEAAVIFLYSFLKIKSIQYKQIKNLPSHMFKNLPIIATHSMYQYIVCNLLHTLKYIKQGTNVYLRFAFNRIYTIKLLQQILKKTKIQNKVITYYLQQLCLQVKIGQIQRACICQVIQQYIKNNTNIKSDIFNKFVQLGKLKYNLKFINKNIKISKQELLTQLEDDQDSCKKEYFIIGYKFVLEKVLLKVVTYNFNDKLLWQQLLPNLINSKEDQDVRIKTSSMIQKQVGQNLNKDQGFYQNSSDQDNGEKREHVSVLQPDDKVHEKVQQA